MAWVTYRMKIWRRLAQGVSEWRRFKFKGFGYPRIFKRRNYTLDPIWNVLEVQERARGSLAVSISPCRVWWGSESDCARHATGGAKSDDELFVTGRLQLCAMHMLWYFDLVGGGDFDVLRPAPIGVWNLVWRGLLDAEYHPHRCIGWSVLPPQKKITKFLPNSAMIVHSALARSASATLARCFLRYTPPATALLRRLRDVIAAMTSALRP